MLRTQFLRLKKLAHLEIAFGNFYRPILLELRFPIIYLLLIFHWLNLAELHGPPNILCDQCHEVVIVFKKWLTEFDHRPTIKEMCFASSDGDANSSCDYIIDEYYQHYIDKFNNLIDGKVICEKTDHCTSTYASEDSFSEHEDVDEFLNFQSPSSNAFDSLAGSAEYDDCISAADGLKLKISSINLDKSSLFSVDSKICKFSLKLISERLLICRNLILSLGNEILKKFLSKVNPNAICYPKLNQKASDSSCAKQSEADFILIFFQIVSFYFTYKYHVV